MVEELEPQAGYAGHSCQVYERSEAHKTGETGTLYAHASSCPESNAQRIDGEQSLGQVLDSWRQGYKTAGTRPVAFLSLFQNQASDRSIKVLSFRRDTREPGMRSYSGTHFLAYDGLGR
jgi:hypothetical protein